MNPRDRKLLRLLLSQRLEEIERKQPERLDFVRAILAWHADTASSFEERRQAVCDILDPVEEP